MNVPTKVMPTADVIESVLIRGDLSKLNETQRNEYYLRVCESVGLNPLTQPFAYLTLNGKLQLYAQKNCTDQLRSIYSVSVVDLTETERDGVFIVTAKVQGAGGRTDMAKGAVTINNLKGDALANALMKAETKAKRRATLSLCGLGMLDEIEVETIPAGARATNGANVAPAPEAPKQIEAPHHPETGEVSPHAIPTANTKFPDWGGKYIAAINSANDRMELNQWLVLNKDSLDAVERGAPKVYKHIMAATQDKLAALSKAAEQAPAQESTFAELYP